MAEFRCGFIGLVGPTNSGKSTLLNAILGEKVSIVSPKPQTTLRSVKGILNLPDSQLVFVDLPGLQKKLQTMIGQLNQLTQEQAGGCDVLLFIYDSSNRNCLSHIEQTTKLLEKFKNKTKICLLNKVDKIPKPSLLPMIEKIHNKNVFESVVPLSALKGDNVTDLVALLEKHIPEGPALYPRDRTTDRDEGFRISELVREKIYQITKQEIPYSVRIEVEAIPSDSKRGIPSFMVKIHSDSDSRKGILVGKKGNVVKEIGVRARRDVERMLGKQVCLKLVVDVDRSWRDDKRRVREYLELGN